MSNYNPFEWAHYVSLGCDHNTYLQRLYERHLPRHPEY